MEIRVASPVDVDSIAALNVDVQNIHAAAHPHIFKSVSDGEFAKAYIAEQLSKPDHFFFLANLLDFFIHFIGEFLEVLLTSLEIIF